MNKTRTYFQPCIGEDNSTGLPMELFSFQAFSSEYDCRCWMLRNGYRHFRIVEYHDDDIENVTILDAKGETIEINE